ncbi:hypothetical protein Plhal304r1_c031g0101701 [Plasmopara halstedii]
MLKLLSSIFQNKSDPKIGISGSAARSGSQRALQQRKLTRASRETVALPR